MKLIGMLDSPYVRRTAISLRLLNLRFDHASVSVFSDYDRFKQLNPVVKAPTLLLDDGRVLMDSTLIIDYAERLAGRSLMPGDIRLRGQATAAVGLALAAAEKSVQIVYEHNLRPPEKQHGPWLARVEEQLRGAYGALEEALQQKLPPADSGALGLASVTAAVVWRFTQLVLPELLRAADYPRLVQLSEEAERLPEFLAFPPV